MTITLNFIYPKVVIRYRRLQKSFQKLPQHDFYERLTTTFGIPKENCVNMYGVTELSTNFTIKVIPFLLQLNIVLIGVEVEL